MRWLVLIALLGAPLLTGQWTRIVQDAGSPVPRPEPPRKLSYFHGDPCSRDDRRFCLHRPTVAGSEVRIVAGLAGIIVYEARYTVRSEGRPRMRSIFVKAAGGRYYEILFQEGGPFWTFDPVEVFFADGTAILKASYQDGSIIGGFSRTFVLTGGGAWELDFSPARAQADSALPSDKETYLSHVDFGTMTIYYPTLPRDGEFGPKVRCCDGRIDVPFRIVQGRVVPGEARYSAIGREH